jgi:amino acid adenylation domain-containing protein
MTKDASMKSTSDSRLDHAIAIIGMSGRFPGANSIDALWGNICAGKDCITRFSVSEIEDAFSAAERANGAYVRARSVLDGVEMFDAVFFGMKPRDAELTDPQQRVFLELCWEAFESAGHRPSRCASTGVFAGSSMNTYFLRHVLRDRGKVEDFTSHFQVGRYGELLGALQDFLASRVSYKLGLTGPSMSVSTACSTSLSAVTLACQSLQLHQCDMALAGGVSITFPQARGYFYAEGGIASPDGRCRPYDADAAGTVFGHGAGVVLLKRYDEALRDGDFIHAVILGYGVNNDGAGKVGFAAPSVEGQKEAMLAAYAMADIDPATVSYVEGHGTATPLGDPIEVAALSAVLGGGGAPCWLGSVKANLGHLDAAAGVTGLIAAASALRTKTLPPLHNFTSPNPRFDLAGTRFAFNRAQTPWAANGPRRAAVNSLGVGGTNVHVVLEEAPPRETRPETAHRSVILPISAKTAKAAAESARRLADALEQPSAPALIDAAHTMQDGREQFPVRAAVAASCAGEAAGKLRDAAMRLDARGAPKAAKVAFLFPGQGSQHPGMGQALYEADIDFRAEADRGLALASDLLGVDLKSKLFPAQPDSAAEDAIRSTVLAQPALFIVEHATAGVLLRRGVRPDAMAGHSLGEFVAAALAGVFSYDTALRIVIARAKLMAAVEPGAMLSVRLPAEELARRLPPGVDIAAVNSPALSVASGPFDRIEALEAALQADGVAFRRLHTSHAFHSAMMDGVVPALAEIVSRQRLSSPTIPILSSVTGRWLTDAEATSAAYWARHCRETVRFADAVTALAGGDGALLLEVGPGDTLSTLARQCLPKREDVAALQTLPSADEPTALANDLIGDAIGAVWASGRDVIWPESSGARVPLPGYAFERARHFIEAPAKAAPEIAVRSATPALKEAPKNLESRPASCDQDHSDCAYARSIMAILAEVSGESLDGVDPRASFLELGYDSLLLGQVAQRINKTHKANVTFRQLMREYPTIEALAAHLRGAAPQLAAAQLSAQSVPAVRPAAVAEAPKRFDTFIVSAGGGMELTAPQKAFVADMARALKAKMGGSKRYTQTHRQRLADPRVAAGFDARWKDLVFPIVTDKASGSQIFDIDGNAYVDVVNGFGQTAFGHNPPFVIEAVERQMRDGFPIGPQAHLAGEVADMLCEMTGNERATFCNTGSEAVMAAMRVARAVTGRDRIVFFTGAYHGQFDEVLAKQGQNGVIPAASGIPRGNLGNISILPYGAPESLDWIAANAEDLAAVMIEPVQSRRPNLRPKEFIQQLRLITENAGAALIFDEVVTGFRVHLGGMQAVYGVQADMATYGKVLGGGMPIGVLAGKAAFMDALDGGQWRYGDDSVPEVAPTFLAGTFVRHPLALAAAKAVLLHLREHGQPLLDGLSERTAALAERLNGCFASHGVASRADHFASWLYFAPAAENPLAKLFFPHMRLKGVHVQEGFPWFITTAHSTADFEAIETAVRDTMRAMSEAEVWGRPASSAAIAPGPQTAAPSEPMREVYLAAQFGPMASCAFNEGLTLRLDGELNANSLAESCKAVFARHPMLRASFGGTGESIEIAPPGEMSIPIADLSAEADPEAALSALVLLDQATPFDLENGPLARAQIIRLAPQRHVFVFCAHHSIFDGWSAAVFISELAALYNARIAGRAAALADPAPLEHILRPLAAEDSATERYWLAQCAEPPEPLELPVDGQRPPRKSFRGATAYGDISAPVRDAVKRFSKAQGVTPFATLLTAVKILLARLSGQTDICVAVPMAGQQGDSGEALIGHLVNFLPIRATVEPDLAPEALVKRVRDSLFGAYDHQDFTLGRIVERLDLPRGFARTPITDVQFNLESEVADPGFTGLTCRMRASPKTAVNLDLFFNVVEAQGGYRVEVDYNSDVYSAETIGRWVGHLETLLSAMTEAQGATVAALPLMSEPEIAWLRDTVNSTHRPAPALLVPEAISRRAIVSGERIALVHGVREMSYAELEQSSDAFARILAAQTPAGGRVAVAVERSCELVAILLAVWKAGLAFVPLDPSHPLARLADTMKAGAVSAVVASSEAILDAAPAGAERFRPADITAHAQRDMANPALPPIADPQATAYVIFTSGSTGTPKGVEVSHGALANFMASMAERPGMSEDDTLVAVTTVCFDIAMLELFLPLICGAKCVIADRAEVLDGFALVNLIERAGATVVQATPSLWRMLVEAGLKPNPALRILCGGEPLPRDLADALLDRGGELWNIYGPTETTIWSSVDKVERGGAITIGSPIANTELHVVDANGGLAPIGVWGELVIGGDGLAKGYFNRPDLTAAAFQTLSIAGGTPRRYYRTGDVAARRADGRIVLRGRSDHQVKVRGFRIELEEIETVLRAAPGVADAGACVVASAAGDARIAASVAVQQGAAVTPDALARHARFKLPDYMIPTLWVVGNALPRTANGKLDRKTLAATVASNAASAGSEPKTAGRALLPEEEPVAAVIAEVLGVRPGAEDDILSLGADSLRVFRIVARLRREGYSVSAQQLFEGATIEAIVRAHTAETSQPAVRRLPDLKSYRGGQRRTEAAE